MLDEKTVLEVLTDELDNYKPRFKSEDEAFDHLENVLHETIEGSLIYTRDIISAWDWETHENVEMSNHTDITSAITESVYWQLRDEFSDLRFDALDIHLSRLARSIDLEEVEDDITGETWPVSEFIAQVENGGFDRDTAIYYLNQYVGE